MCSYKRVIRRVIRGVILEKNAKNRAFSAVQAVEVDRDR